MPDMSKITGKPNRLIKEKSPYLLQHAYNPVDWYAWGDEPFARAQKEDKPLFLSIGYSTCHWCHVMEKESFENQEIAEILNNHFIAIKVDREERPDIDQLYMLATQAMTGGGGWPMSVFLFPDAKPFYAGTYFPPEPRFNHPGFPELLTVIVRTWNENRDGLQGSADKVMDFLENVSRTEPAAQLASGWSDTGFQALAESYDRQYHGFGDTNKFPRPSCFDFLLSYAYRTGNSKAVSMTRETLRAMALGGMYDHLGGGFHRYSVDRQWRIPHFEKMLYDQAQLIISYLQMYQLSKEQAFADIAEETIAYVLRDLQHPGGGLYSAEDADSVNPYDPGEHSEGAYYLWQEKEIRECLGKETAEVFNFCYGVQPDGNALADPAGEFTGRNILYREKSAGEAAALFALSSEEVVDILQKARRSLLTRRNGRTRPHLDDKIITSWNGLMISALAQAGRILKSPEYIHQAERVAGFLLDNVQEDNLLKRRWREGEARFDGVLEDYAFLIQGLLDLYAASHVPAYLQSAIDLTQTQEQLFSDPSGGFFSSQKSAGLLTRIKETYDGAEPSGNSVSALNFLRLGRMLKRDDWTDIGEKTIKTCAKTLAAQGLAMPLMLKALEMSLLPPQQLMVCGDPGAKDTTTLLKEANSRYLPHLQIVFADGDSNQKLLAGFSARFHDFERINGKATAYLCKDFTCQKPTTDPQELARLLNEMLS